VIDDLRIAIERNPHQPILWQALGDAYMKADRLSEAIEAYRKGTEATT
jgi:cytochrome c-type biogenesis protein CcmH/NrfG